jgi:hypothetical protein
VFCRSEAAKLHERKAEINDLGCDLVCLLKENIADEVEAFHREPYWSPSTPLYLDEDMTFFKALGGGKVRKGGLSSFFKPGLWKRYGKMDKATKEDANLKGEGTILGGTYVVSKEGVQYQFKEKDFGVAAPLDEIIDACKRAAGKCARDDDEDDDDDDDDDDDETRAERLGPNATTMKPPPTPLASPARDGGWRSVSQRVRSRVGHRALRSRSRSRVRDSSRTRSFIRFFRRASALMRTRHPDFVQPDRISTRPERSRRLASQALCPSFFASSSARFAFFSSSSFSFFIFASSSSAASRASASSVRCSFVRSASFAGGDRYTMTGFLHLWRQ